MTLDAFALPLRRMIRLVAALVATTCLAPPDAAAQNSSLYHEYRRGTNGPATLAETSTFFIPVDPPRKIKVHDIITVMVQLQSQVVSEGEAQVRRNTRYNAVLQDWIGLDGFAIRPDPQSEGDPTVAGQLNHQFRATSDLETTDLIQFTVAAEVVDIRPNNVLVLEATQEVQNNEEFWSRKLIGEVRAEDVLPNNTVLSQNLANLRIFKEEKGAVRDGYKRGWLAKLWDRVTPF